MTARRRWVGPVVALVVLGLLAVGLVVGDQAVEDAFEQRTATETQSSLALDVPPAVDAQEGWPFVAALLGGDVEQVVLRTGATGVGTGPQRIQLERLDLVVEHLRSPDRFATASADRISGTALVGYPEIGRLAGRDVRPGEQTPAGTRWEVRTTTTVLGVDIPVVVTGLPTLDGAYGRQLVLNDVSLRVADYDIPQRVADEIIAGVVQPVPLELPLGLRGDTLASTADGLELGFSGTDVVLG
ncbi:LmeA family phospholipid-binding protein [Desertihabitans aurantiacus]|uniref:LmeA family phospholipid-binding protein n=1 Tax=Desertihabitans aurantiacus TaxID=2282477 RepID=UPI000DF73493|nr:DUF2993 domain-containing protein [Desertihabitans aurantiacus]